MSDNELNELLGRVRGSYHVPPEPPREAMWEGITARLATPDARGDAGAGDTAGDGSVTSLAEARERRSVIRSAMWATAAAAVLVVGIGIGRITAPPSGALPVERAAGEFRPGTGALALAAVEHFGQTESLLTMVRADARNGSLDAGTAERARSLLSETRLLIDSRGAGDPEVDRLLEDLELVLAQIVGAAEAGSDSERGRTEIGLALRGLEDGEVLTRIQAVRPNGLAGA